MGTVYSAVRLCAAGGRVLEIVMERQEPVYGGAMCKRCIFGCFFRNVLHEKVAAVYVFLLIFKY